MRHVEASSRHALASDPEVVALILGDLEATRALAGRIAALARRGDVIGLTGPLGAGKTVFVRDFIRARAAMLQAPAPGEVPSPTFTLVQVYELPQAAVWHIDLYRLETPDEAWELGIEEAFGEGIALIEWPERLGPLLPAGRLEVDLRFVKGPPQARRARLSGHGAWARRLREARLGG
ncbi:MAG: tRNA (adenosine(37)-N6)-threonylcarbamoyltransferase complex ATPase subunit type 1 TsaE [Kiloniellales bacterium]